MLIILLTRLILSKGGGRRGVAHVAASRSLITFNLPRRSCGRREAAGVARFPRGAGPLSVHDRPLIRIIRFRPTLGATFIRRCVLVKTRARRWRPWNLRAPWPHAGATRLSLSLSSSFLLPHPAAVPFAKITCTK